ncbi:MAG: hypothetical protein OXC07_13155, partial [Kistimonas sp.]|nr:hypothetical protein [Kistimonas sp.]
GAGCLCDLLCKGGCAPASPPSLLLGEVQGLNLDLAHLRPGHQWCRVHPELEPDGVPFVPPAVVEQG